MVKLINWLTGGEMYVADERVKEYLAAGHKLPQKKYEPVKKAEAVAEEKPKPRKKSKK